MSGISARSFWVGAATGAVVAGIAAVVAATALMGGRGSSGVASATPAAGIAAASATPAGATPASTATGSALSDQLQAARARIKTLEDPSRSVVTLADGTQFTAQQAAERIAQLQGLEAFAPYLSCAPMLSSSSVDAAVACMKSVAPYASQ